MYTHLRKLNNSCEKNGSLFPSDPAFLMATFPVSQEWTDDARHGLGNRAEGIPPNGGLVMEI